MANVDIDSITDVDQCKELFKQLQQSYSQLQAQLKLKQKEINEQQSIISQNSSQQQQLNNRIGELQQEVTNYKLSQNKVQRQAASQVSSMRKKLYFVCSGSLVGAAIGIGRLVLSGKQRSE